MKLQATHSMTVLEKFEQAGYHPTPASVWVTLAPDKQELLRNCGGFPVNDAFLTIWRRERVTRRELIILYGTYGSSKTHDRILEHLLLSMTEQYFKCFYGRAVFDLAKSEFHSSIVSVIKREGWQDLFEFSEKPNGSKEISCKLTGHKFKPFGCDDEESIGKGWDDATHIMLDEGNQAEFKQFGLLQTRPRKQGVPKAFTMMFNNCDVQGDHWIVTDLLNPDAVLEDDKGKKIERSMIEHFSLFTDNYFIDHDEYRDQLIEQAGSDVERRDAIINGKWGSKTTKQAFYKNFSQKAHVRYVEYNPKLPLHVSFDENRNPYFPCGIFQIQGKDFYMIDEIAAKNPYNTTRWICGEIYRRYGPNGKNHMSGMLVYGDATSVKGDVKMEQGKNTYTQIKEYLEHFKPRMRVGKNNPNVAMRGDFINAVFAANFKGLTITISTKCPTTITDLINTPESPDGDGKLKAKTTVDGVTGVQRYGHFSDLFDYIFISVYASEYHMFQHGGKKPTVGHFEPRRPNNYF